MTVRQNGVVVVDDPDNTLTGGEVQGVLTPGQVGALAHGGDFFGSGPFLVGEEGPELLFPRGGGRGTVVRNDMTQRALARGMGGGNTINVTVRPTWPVSGAEARKVAENIRRALIDLEEEF